MYYDILKRTIEAIIIKKYIVLNLFFACLIRPFNNTQNIPIFNQSNTLSSINESSVYKLKQKLNKIFYNIVDSIVEKDSGRYTLEEIVVNSFSSDPLIQQLEINSFKLFFSNRLLGEQKLFKAERSIVFNYLLYHSEKATLFKKYFLNNTLFKSYVGYVNQCIAESVSDFFSKPQVFKMYIDFLKYTRMLIKQIALLEYA